MSLMSVGERIQSSSKDCKVGTSCILWGGYGSAKAYLDQFDLIKRLSVSKAAKELMGNIPYQPMQSCMFVRFMTGVELVQRIELNDEDECDVEVFKKKIGTQGFHLPPVELALGVALAVEDLPIEHKRTIILLTLPVYDEMEIPYLFKLNFEFKNWTLGCIPAREVDITLRTIVAMSYVPQ